MTAHILSRMVSAEFLKLRRRRSLLWWSLILCCLTVPVVYAVLAVLHVTDAAHYGPAGGAENLGHSLEALSLLGGIAGVMIGATAGAGDLGAGVFRDLVATGRSRLALFGVRLPGALALFVPLIIAGLAIATVCSILLAGSLANPSATLVLHYAAWLLVATTLPLILALGISSLLGSRTITVGVLLGWQLAAGPILGQLGFLGRLRDGISVLATDRLLPVPSGRGGDVAASMPLAVALVVIAAWAAVALGAGAWRTRTMDA
ncbi:MAG: hypothetical protein JWL78_1278 [Chloroflexi bacterium]|jgi:hypothetical protein|nr:hypothetical protein [Chloroflexota bacterium]